MRPSVEIAARLFRIYTMTRFLRTKFVVTLPCEMGGLKGDRVNSIYLEIIWMYLGISLLHYCTMKGLQALVDICLNVYFFIHDLVQ